MKFVLFYHSVVSDWNHGNAHFLRGIAGELVRRGNEVQIFEPRRGWSRRNLLQDHGTEPFRRFRRRFPLLRPRLYDPERIDLDAALDGADVVIVHEWTDPGLARRLARHRSAGGRYRLLFHDTHHGMVSEPGAFAKFGLDAYDGVLAFGEALRRMYADVGWSRNVWSWHEAADTAVFQPMPADRQDGDLIWIGNWGDGERSAEIMAFLLRPARDLDLCLHVHGVRYPDRALRALGAAGATYGGWLANQDAPAVFARYKATVHVPRWPYVARLPGIPTIRPFEALACGIPLVCVRWQDEERLFRPDDMLHAESADDVRRHLRALCHDAAMRQAYAARGLETIRRRHTCAHRVDELLQVCRELGAPEDLQAQPVEAAQ